MLAVALISPPAEANVIVSVYGGMSLLMILALIPVIVIESIVLGMNLGLSVWSAVKVGALANIASTIAGLPLNGYLFSRANEMGPRWLRPIANSIVRYEDGTGKEDPAWIEPVSLAVFLILLYMASWGIELAVGIFLLDNTIRELNHAVIIANLWTYGPISAFVLVLVVSSLRDRNKQIAKVKKMLEKWATEQDQAVAQYNIGLVYDQESFYYKAAKWYRKAADQGHANAQLNLGVLYILGFGVPEDDVEAVKWFRRAAEQGLAVAQHELGGMYFDGKGVTQDSFQAAKWFRKAAEQGHTEAQHKLGVMYADGKGVPQDLAEAVEWYRKAAEQGNAAAQYALAIVYDNGEAVPQDYAVAFKWYRKAAEQGDSEAQYRLGLMHDRGQGVPQDHAEAIKWYLMAAEQECEQAQVDLGNRYRLGQGVPQDYAEAMKWYHKAAEWEHAEAQANLALMYSEGQGVSQDHAEAIKWYGKAAEQGYTPAPFKSIVQEEPDSIFQVEPDTHRPDEDSEKREPERFNITFLGIVGSIMSWIIYFTIYDAFFN